jgi:GT2 family glycosyltransferase
MSQLHIIIPIINEINYTQNCLNSIQASYSYTIHIIDQDSNQETQNWYKDKQNDKFYVHRYSPKVSLSEAWNRGIKEAMTDEECKWMFIINNDVLFHKQTIDNLIDAKLHTNYSMVTCNNVFYKYTESNFKEMEINEDKGEELKPITNWREEGPDFSAFLIDRLTIYDIGWFDENYMPAYYEDNDYHTRILKAGKHAKRIARAPFFHYGSVTAKSTGTSSGYSQFKYQEKWGEMPEKIMDGKGYQTPYNLPDKDWRYWKGVEKYEA